MEMGESLVATAPRYFGSGSQETLTVRDNLALAYQAAGRVGEAIPLFEQGLAATERVLGTEHPTTATIRTNLAEARRLAAGPDNG
jgi:Tetratricopeptide repeat